MRGIVTADFRRGKLVEQPRNVRGLSSLPSGNAGDDIAGRDTRTQFRSHTNHEEQHTGFEQIARTKLIALRRDPSPKWLNAFLGISSPDFLRDFDAQASSAFLFTPPHLTVGRLLGSIHGGVCYDAKTGINGMRNGAVREWYAHLQYS